MSTTNKFFLKGGSNLDERSQQRKRERTKIMQNLQIKVNWPFTKAGDGRSFLPQRLKSARKGRYVSIL